MVQWMYLPSQDQPFLIISFAVQANDYFFLCVKGLILSVSQMINLIRVSNDQFIRVSND